MESNINYNKLGAVEREQSSTDFLLGAITPSQAIPEEFMQSYNSMIEMQAKQPCCGSCSGTELKSLQDGGDYSFEYLWKKIKTLDGISAESGTTLDCIMKALNKFGVCSSSLLQSDTSLSIDSFASEEGITGQMDKDALNHRVGAYAFSWSPSFEDIKKAIYNHKAVILLLRIGSEWWIPSYQEKDILPLKTDKPVISGHFVTAFAYDKDYIYFINHWDTNWGRNGIGYFGSDYASRVIEIGTAVDLNGYTFPRDLKFGMTGTDVGILQSYLKKEGLFNAKITSYFGRITEESVKAFQAKYANDCLVPAGIQTGVGTGYVGEFTRKKLEKLYS